MKVSTEMLRREDAVLVSIEATRGSAPRAAGAWMAVFAQHVVGTIGGGQLEFQAIAEARRRLAGGQGEAARQVALGPSLGQCCGGGVRLRFELVAGRDIPALEQRLAPSLLPVAVFGAGHVGTALVNALAPLPFAVTWIDSRDEIFPERLPQHVVCEHSDPVHGAVPHLVPGSRVLVMSFSHAEDLAIVLACLQRLRERGDLPFVGVIGSSTKWATFRHRLAERGFSDEEMARVTCPIGLPGIVGKEPAVIAASVAAQMLQLAPPRASRDGDSCHHAAAPLT